MGRKERTWIQTPRLQAFVSFQRTVYTCTWQHVIKQQNKYLPHRLSLPESLIECNGISHWRGDNQGIPQSPSIPPYLNLLWKKASQLGLRTVKPTRLFKGEIESPHGVFWRKTVWIRGKVPERAPSQKISWWLCKIVPAWPLRDLKEGGLEKWVGWYDTRLYVNYQ